MREPSKIVRLVEYKTEPHREYVEFIYDAEPRARAEAFRWLLDSPVKVARVALLVAGWAAFNATAGALELALLGGHLIRRELAAYAQSLGNPSLAPWLQSGGGKAEKRLTSGGDES